MAEVGKMASEDPKSEEEESMVLLWNFETAALNLPITGELCAFEKGECVLRVDAVPAAWNERFADALRTQSGLSGSPTAVLGSELWKQTVRKGGCVLLERDAQCLLTE